LKRNETGKCEILLRRGRAEGVIIINLFNVGGGAHNLLELMTALDDSSIQEREWKHI
jgi:hypothetical protein